MSNKLKELTSKIGSGATPRGGESAYKEIGISLIRSQNVLDFAFDYDNLAHIDNDQANLLSSVIVESKDLLFNITGDSIARCTIVPDDILPARVNQHVAIIRATKISNEYLLYFLQHRKNRLVQMSKIGGTRKALTKEMLEQFDILRLENEKEIANTLAVLDRKIAIINTINAELESAARILYDYWFTQFDFPDANGKPYKSSGGAMVWSEELKREIPQGWEMAHLSNELTFKRGVEPGSDAYSAEFSDTHTVPFIRVRDLRDKSAVYIQPEIANGCLCEPNDVLVAFDGSVGKMAIGMRGCYSSGIRNVKPRNNKFSQAFIYLYFSSQEAQSTIEKYAVGSNILHAASCIEHFLFAYEEKTVNEFIHRIEPMYCQMVANLQQNEELTELRNFLLPLLMNGQVRVANGSQNKV